MKGMILGAGLGTRFRPHTEKLAKPALPFLNIPLLAYSLYHIESLGAVKDVVLNTHHLPETVRAAAHAVADERSYALHFTSEQPRILGSGGGIRLASSLLRGGAGHFVVCNGDEVIFFKKPGGFRRMMDAHLASGAIATLMTMDHADVGVTMNGLRVDATGAITEYSVREKGLAHFTGVFIFSEKIFDYMPAISEFHIFKDVLVHAQARGEKVMSYHENDLLWLETTDEKSFIESTDIAIDHWRRQTDFALEMRAIFERYHQHFTVEKPGVWLGAEAVLSPEADIAPDASLMLGAGAVVDAGVNVRGFAVVGPRAHVTKGTVLDQAVVAPGVEVPGSFSARRTLVL